MGELSEMCAYYKISRSQRENERAQGLDDVGTTGFEDKGCYNCNGLNKDCTTYYSSKKPQEKMQ